jgi:hypothetical protein
VAGLPQREPQGGDLAGEELGVGEVALVAAAVLLEGDPVAVGLPVLGEQDQRRGIRGLQTQDQREQGVVEVTRVELQVLGPQVFQSSQIPTKTVIPMRNCGVPHEAGELLRDDPEGSWSVNDGG